MSEAITRREFAKLSAVLAISAATTGVVGCDKQDKPAEKIETPTMEFGGGDGMSAKVLVGYATRTGSTVGVAEAIGKALGERGFEVDVKPLREHPSLDGYAAVVLGSAINGAQWLPEAVSFAQSNQSRLSKLPVAVFCVHSMNGGSDAKQTKKRLAYLDAVRAMFKPVDEGFFLGKGPDPDDTSLIARWAFKAFGGSGEGDMRDWDKIRAWAEEVTV